MKNPLKYFSLLEWSVIIAILLLGLRMLNHLYYAVMVWRLR